YILFFIILFLGVFSFALLIQNKPSNELIKVWPGGILEVDGNKIILGINCTAIVAETSSERAENIQLGLNKIISKRPSTYDTFYEVLKSFNITLERVELLYFDGKYYYADAVFKSKDKQLRIDLMPSDAIGLAVRADAEIYVNKSLLYEIGKDICEEE
ncbi:MAG: DUF151 domain-containing protein, partial [Candidatus Aenigmatarchaeota archaeon]